jgi:hypothetical protein
MHKAYRAFWTCKSTFGKTWGLKPRVVHWIYTMVIRLILTYGSTVWWSRVRYNVSRTELSKIQRISLSGYYRGSEDDPNSGNGCPPGISSSSYDD